MHAIEVLQTPEYEAWFDGLRDREARFRVDVRLRRLSLGNMGDVRTVGDGVLELRIPYGPGYRVYLKWQAEAEVVLLTGGDKSSQERDIERAKSLARRL